MLNDEKKTTKKYQSLDNDPDSDEECVEEIKEEEPLTKSQNKPLTNPEEKIEKPKNKGGRPKVYDKPMENYVDMDDVKKAFEEGKIKLTKAQKKGLVPKLKRQVSDKERERLREMGRKGLAKAREVLEKKRAEAKRLKEEEEKKREEELIEKRKTMIKCVREPSKAYLRKMELDKKKKEEKEEKEVEEGGYGDTETDGDTTDTREIKRVKKKINMVKETKKIIETPHPQPINKSYRDMSLLEKLYTKI